MIEEMEISIRCTVVGNDGSGKTSLIKRYTEGTFNPDIPNSSPCGKYVEKRLLSRESYSIIRKRCYFAHF